MQTVYQKVLNVMASVDSVAKNGRNTFQKYDYVTEADILAAIRGSLIDNKLLILPSVKEVRHDTRGESAFITLLMEFTVVDAETGESFVSPFVGTGEDKGDKGAYKALTGAMKYFLLKTFLIPTGDDPENDSAPAPKTTSRSTANKPATSPSGVVTCEYPGCGVVIKGSAKYPVDMLVQMSRERFGKVLCYDHGQGAKKVSPR